MGINQPISFEDGKHECKPLVLVVDDDHTHRKLMELLADRLGITAQCVSSCSEALAVMDLFSFDLLLMDCRMPDLDGCQCTRKIRELANENALPIIAVTACVLKADRDRCLDSGMDDYLMKPFTLEQMHEKLNIWLHKREPN